MKRIICITSLSALLIFSGCGFLGGGECVGAGKSKTTPCPSTVKDSNQVYKKKHRTYDD